MHITDSVATAARLDMIAAFTALGQYSCTHDFGGVVTDLVGMVLVPGVYCSTQFLISGALVLDGTSQPAGVWIFKSGSSIVLTGGQVSVIGAGPCSVWWRAVSSVTIGTYSTMVGNVLASTSITILTGATLNGRALANTATVTMDTNTVITPVSCSATSAAPPTPSPLPVASSTSTVGGAQNSPTLGAAAEFSVLAGASGCCHSSCVTVSTESGSCMSNVVCIVLRSVLVEVARLSGNWAGVLQD